jgi:ribosomal protein L11
MQCLFLKNQRKHIIFKKGLPCPVVIIIQNTNKLNWLGGKPPIGLLFAKYF